MNDKCEWKDGKFNMCQVMYNYMASDQEAWKLENGCFITHQTRWDYCPFCGADIRKPEKKVCTQTGGCLSNWTCKTCCFYEPEPKQPTHEEIMTKWWKTNAGNWQKVRQYSEVLGYWLTGEWHTSIDYIGRESADIPPEAT